MDGKSSSASWRKPITVGFVLQNNALWKVGSCVVMLLLLLEQSYLASTINNTHLQMCYTGIRLLVQKPLENRSPKQISALLWRFTNDSSRVTRHQRLRRVSSHHAIGYPCKVNPFRISRFVIWRRGKILNIVLAYCNWIHLIIQMYIYIYTWHIWYSCMYIWTDPIPFPKPIGEWHPCLLSLKPTQLSGKCGICPPVLDWIRHPIQQNEVVPTLALQRSWLGLASRLWDWKRTQNVRIIYNLSGICRNTP